MTPKPIVEAETSFLKRYQLIVAILGGILIPTIAGVGGYYRANADMTQRIDKVQLDNANTYAKTSDLKDLRDRLDKISSDVSEIKGFLYKHKN